MDRAWPTVAPLLADALARNAFGTTLADIKRSLDQQESMLWVVQCGEKTTAATVCYPDRKAQSLHVWLLGGRDLEDWVDLLMDRMKRYARQEGLRALQASTRPGLARKLAAKGWKTQHIVTRCEL